MGLLADEDEFDDLRILLNCLEQLEERGLERFQIHAFQKHGDLTAIVPEGHINAMSLAWQLRTIMLEAEQSMAVKRFGRAIFGKPDSEDILCD